MTKTQKTVTLDDQITHLREIIDQSPYLSQQGRKSLENEMHDIAEKSREGHLNFNQAEKTLAEINKKAAADEIESLIKKIGHLNPASPRLMALRAINNSLTYGEVSPEQARTTLYEIMGK